VTAAITIDEVLRDPNLLGAALGDPSSWSTWLSVLKAAFGQPLDTDEAAAFSAVAGGRASPLERVRELWAAVGRRAGKSRLAAAVEAARAEDPEGARAEWDAEFRTDISSYTLIDAVSAVVSWGVRERGPRAGVRYVGFIDPSGGSSDSMTLAIAHKENKTAILDCVRERRPPFSPEDIALLQEVRGWIHRSPRGSAPRGSCRSPARATRRR
jgi:hypothetical protein